VWHCGFLKGEAEELESIFASHQVIKIQKQQASTFCLYGKLTTINLCGAVDPARQH